jgi:hypothetical protein
VFADHLGPPELERLADELEAGLVAAEPVKR